MDGLYDIDILTWSERQAALLRRLAAGERLNEELDWPNVIEEIESVGRSDLHSVESLLTQAMLHEIKARAWPDALAVPHWEAEARLFRSQAAARFTESMRQRLDVAALCRIAWRGVPATIDGQPPRVLASEYAVTLDDLLAAA